MRHRNREYEFLPVQFVHSEVFGVPNGSAAIVNEADESNIDVALGQGIMLSRY
jgi:hypothetical protein